MLRLVLLFCCVTLGVLAGCSGEEGLRCEDQSRYATSVSAPPIRVPDDLTVPDESDSLLIPDSAPPGTVAPTECLETPPPYDEQNSEGR